IKDCADTGIVVNGADVTRPLIALNNLESCGDNITTTDTVDPPQNKQLG
ncbi:unnamed protein product, partial [marine sediment metagenome]